ncbi:hypothetical protein Hdeb2414_s0010g00344701 [Helianthus debilis subsp. tardiflorus]
MHGAAKIIAPPPKIRLMAPLVAVCRRYTGAMRAYRPIMPPHYVRTNTRLILAFIRGLDVIGFQQGDYGFS